MNFSKLIFLFVTILIISIYTEQSRSAMQAFWFWHPRYKTHHYKQGFNQKDYDEVMKTGKCCNCALEGADFSQQDFEKKFTTINLSLSNLQGASFKNSRFPSGTNFTGCNLKNAHFEHASLPGAHFTEATLKNANISHANLQNAWFSYTNLKNMIAHGTLFDRALFSNVKAQNADLSNASLGGAIMVDSLLKNTIFTQALFKESTMIVNNDLNKAQLRYAQGITKSLLHECNLTDAQLPEKLD